MLRDCGGSIGAAAAPFLFPFLALFSFSVPACVRVSLVVWYFFIVFVSFFLLSFTSLWQGVGITHIHTHVYIYIYIYIHIYIAFSHPVDCVPLCTMSAKFFQRAMVGVAAASAGFYSCCFVVHPGEAAILYNKITGLKESVYGEGLQCRILGLDDIKLFNIRVRPRVLQTMTGTKDLQMVNIRLRVLFRPQTQRLPQIFRTFGMDYDERILPSVSNEILKAVVAEYKAEELIQKRDAVSARVYQLMQEKVAQFGLVLEDLSLVDIQFGKEFMIAVEQKQVAQQEAERFRYVVQENEQKKRAAIVRAEGEAESARLISEAIKRSGKGLLELRRIEAAVDIASQLVPMRNVTFLPGGSNILLNMKSQNI